MTVEETEYDCVILAVGLRGRVLITACKRCKFGEIISCSAAGCFPAALSRPPAPTLEEVLERGAKRGKVQLAWGEPLTKLLQLGTYEDSFYLKDLLRPSTAQTKHKQIGNRDRMRREEWRREQVPRRSNWKGTFRRVTGSHKAIKLQI